MEAAGRLVVGLKVAQVAGRVGGDTIQVISRHLVRIRLRVSGALIAQSAQLLVARIVAFGVVIDVGEEALHVVERADDGRLDARVDRGLIDRHAAPATDAHEANLRDVDVAQAHQIVHGRAEVLRVNVWCGHAAHLAAALARERGVEGQGHKAARCQLLGVESGGLLLDRPEGPADGHGGVSLRCLIAFGHVEVAGQLYPEAVFEAHALHIDRRIDLEDARVVSQHIDCGRLLFLFCFLPVGCAPM